MREDGGHRVRLPPRPLDPGFEVFFESIVAIVLGPVTVAVSPQVRGDRAEQIPEFGRDAVPPVGVGGRSVKEEEDGLVFPPRDRGREAGLRNVR